MGAITRALANNITTGGVILPSGINNTSISNVTALPAGVGGKVLQVVSTHKQDDFTTSSGSFTDVTGLSVSITPSSTSSKILVSFSIMASNDTTSTGTHIKLLRDSTDIAPGRSDVGYESSWHVFHYNDLNITQQKSHTVLDSPSTTSSITYKVQVKPQGNTAVVNRSGDDISSAAYSHKSSSSITVYEIAG